MLLCMILKVIGLVLLFLLLLLLLLLGLVLLVPIRYAGAGHKGEKKKDYAAHVDVSWFLHLVQLHAGLTPAGLACDLTIQEIREGGDAEHDQRRDAERIVLSALQEKHYHKHRNQYNT